MISNQYQNQLSFQGNLLKKGINIPEKKFKEVAKIYAEKTKGKPDLILVGSTENEIFSGKFCHFTTVYRGKDDIADIATISLKEMFRLFPSKKMADELVNVSRKTDLEDDAAILKRKIDNTKHRLKAVEVQIEKNKAPGVLSNLKVIAERMQDSIKNDEKRLARIQPKRVSKAWCI